MKGLMGTGFPLKRLCALRREPHKVDLEAYGQAWDRFGGKVLILEPELWNRYDDRKGTCYSGG